MPVHGTAGMSRAIGPGEVHALLAAAKTSRDWLLIQLLWSTGCRVGEVVLLRRGHLNAEDRVLTLRNLKRRKTAENPDGYGEKDVVIDESLVDAIEAYCDAAGISRGDYVFPGRDRKEHLCIRQARSIVYQTSVLAMVTQIHPGDSLPRPIWPHVLRHSSARQLLRSGVNLKIIADRLGHSQIRNTALYLASDTEEQKVAVAGVKW